MANRDKTTEIELAQKAMEILELSRRGVLARTYGPQFDTGNPFDVRPTNDQLAAAAIVEMCRKAFAGE
jgi:hypothetical protein